MSSPPPQKVRKTTKSNTAELESVKPSDVAEPLNPIPAPTTALTLTPTPAPTTALTLTPTPAPNPKTPFTNIPQGAGATYPLTLTPPTTIGTTACNTCLGLYAPLTASTCFIAHFNLEPQANTDQPREQRPENYEVGPACYRAVVMMTKEFLNAAQWKGRWGPLTQEMRGGLRMVCPTSGIVGTVYVGDAIAEGVREFFGVVPRRCENLLVVYAEGSEPVVMYPGEVELERDWEARNAEDNEEFAMSEFFDDGRVMQGDTAEGPFV